MFIEISFRKRLLTSQGEIDMSIDMSVLKGDIVTVFGKSGAGKTTLLRVLAGLTNPDEGSILVDGKTWFDQRKKINLKPQIRSTGFVFQDYALFPNMTVKQNLAYAVKDNIYVEELLRLMDLKVLENQKSSHLSGGQQQRVALARAMAQKPKVLLLDEPLAALDVDMRHELQDEILKLNKELGLTILLVSHDLSEIFKLSDKVFVIDNGRLVKSGTPVQVFAHEKFSAKFQFIGEILSIVPSDCIYICNILIGNNIIKIVLSREEAKSYKIGEKVVVGSKAFNPIIKKLNGKTED